MGGGASLCFGNFDEDELQIETSAEEWGASSQKASCFGVGRRRALVFLKTYALGLRCRVFLA